MDLPDYKNIMAWWGAFKKCPRHYRLLIELLAVLLILVSAIWFIFKYDEVITKGEGKPQFLICNPNVRAGSTISVFAENKSANTKKPLKVEYDGIVFPSMAGPVPKTNPQMWHITLFDKGIPDDMLNEGRHKLRFAFIGEAFSEFSEIIISEKASVPSLDGAEYEVSESESNEIETVKANTTRSFLAAIKSNRIIKLEAGTYNLSIAAQSKSRHLAWIKTYDGFEPLVHNIANLKIIGEPGVKILIEPRYAWVLSFQNCRNIVLENLSIGHTLAGYCSGGVISFLGCENIEIGDSILFGSGTSGIQIDKVDRFAFLNSTIKDCTYELVGIYGSTNILFESSVFENTGQFNLISISESAHNIRFSKCSIKNNWTGDYMSYLFYIGEQSGLVSLIDCRIAGNRIKMFSNAVNMIVMENNIFTNNSFTALSDNNYNEYNIHK